MTVKSSVDAVTSTRLQPQPVDFSTKINISILLTMLACVFGAGAYLTTLKNSIDTMAERVHEVKVAIDRNTSQITTDGRALHVLQSQVQMMNDRYATLEARMNDVIMRLSKIESQ